MRESLRPSQEIVNRPPDLLGLASGGMALDDITTFVARFRALGIAPDPANPDLHRLAARIGEERVAPLFEAGGRLRSLTAQDLLAIAPSRLPPRRDGRTPVYFAPDMYNDQWLIDPRAWQLTLPDPYTLNVTSNVSRHDLVAAVHPFLERSPFARSRIQGSDFCVVDSLKEGQLHSILRVRPVFRSNPEVDRSFVMVVSKSVDANAITKQDGASLRDLQSTGRVPEVYEFGTLDTRDRNVVLLVEYIPSREIQLTHGGNEDQPEFRFLDREHPELDISPLRLGPEMVAATFEVVCHDERVRCFPDVIRGDWVLDDSGKVRLISCASRGVRDRFFSIVPSESVVREKIRQYLAPTGREHLVDHVYAFYDLLRPKIAIDSDCGRDRFRGMAVHMHTAMDLLCGMANARLNAVQTSRALTAFYAALSATTLQGTDRTSRIVSGWSDLYLELNTVIEPIRNGGSLTGDQLHERLQTLIRSKKMLAREGRLNTPQTRYV